MRNTVSFSHKAVFYQSSQISEQTDEIWFVLHGYGQLPQYFIRKFKGIENDRRVIVAPGGLSRFYLDGFSGRVGSTWMTKEERLIDIENYIGYLDQVAENVLSKASKDVRITLLGFSQGSATVCRWAEKLSFPFEKLILHSGAFPPDIDFSGLSNKLKNNKVYMLRGTEDEFINEERKKEQKSLIEKLNIEVKEIEFEGKHDIHIESLKEIIKQ
ncbi:esterase [Marivirga tractuosa]|uniref:Phospholipase/Carboxylesterase n=1 Tax=Marivirga tractuosa (strain ATCC 23168 / DSM 4126 / NBRC 15989 / NCIMB 1408 / VKM B-1430 / H-43) TaxID=643867 RepID=E4TQL7_MARTH|nr:phospholipase/carboxylesterase [Marivirga tractuosa]ADR23710.1 phospholipase/Carboxylesterase [Marivirga tractuosa DSM 4126]BDD15609.1 esterase [Marivirga tractuosa]